jgi:hypothetical protein
LTAALALGGCGKSTPPPAPKVPSSPVPAPDALVADLSLRGPDALWGRLQHGIAGPLAHLPATFGGALATTAKLDLTLAGEIDGAAPAFAVIARPGASFGWVAALRVRDLDHARAALLGGKQPRFSGRDADGGLTVLQPAPSPGASPAATPAPAPYMLALSPLGYLVVAGSEADLVTLTPYATRTLPARAASAHAAVVSVPHGALTGPIKDRLTALAGDLRGAAAMLDSTLRTQHGGRAPELGDPGAVIEGVDDLVHEKIATLATLDHLELTLDAGDDDVAVEATLVPGAGAAATTFGSITTGDASPLLTVSASTQAAVLFRDDPASLQASAKAAEERTVAVLKPALGPKDRAPIHDALGTWATARGPWLTAGLELDDAPAVTVRTPTTDPELAMRGVSALVNLADVPAFRGILEARFSVEGVSTATATTPGGAASIATFRRAGHGGGPELAIAWATTGGLLHVAAAGSSAQALRASKDPLDLAGRDVAFAGKLGTLRDRAHIVIAGRRNLDGRPDEKRASVVLGLGRDKANGWGMLEVDDAWLREGATRLLDL